MSEAQIRFVLVDAIARSSMAIIIEQGIMSTITARSLMSRSRVE